MKLKKIICWPPLLGGIGAGVTIGILAYITFQSFLAGTIYGLWLVTSFGSSVVVVFGYPDNEFAQPKNVLLGHLLCAFIGIVFVIFFKVSQDRTIFFLAIGLAVGLAVMLMMALKITHPPAGGNTILVMLTQDSFQFLIFPILVGAITIIIGGVIYNRIILKKNYPLKWF
jgi:CBS-domain-containing membrane protein|tara:strand:+ start:1078 stop:1587 length:510 start_codon:yes stop_codon:yes gene_type:complete